MNPVPQPVEIGHHHAFGGDGFHDLHGDLPGADQLRSRLPYFTASGYGGGKDRRPQVAGDRESSLLEAHHPAVPRPGSFRIDHQRPPAFHVPAGTLVDRLVGGVSAAPVYLHYPDLPHGRSEQGDIEKLRLGQEADGDGQHREVGEDVEGRSVVGDHHVGAVVVDVLQALDCQLHPGRPAPGPAPAAGDGVEHRRGWAH